MPLSETRLWEAVIMRPVTERVFNDLSAARIPTLKTVAERIEASERNPAVPYENLTPEIRQGIEWEFQNLQSNKKMGILITRIHFRNLE